MSITHYRLKEIHRCQVETLKLNGSVLPTRTSDHHRRQIVLQYRHLCSRIDVADLKNHSGRVYDAIIELCTSVAVILCVAIPSDICEIGSGLGQRCPCVGLLAQVDHAAAWDHGLEQVEVGTRG